jgi:hypothetical protein
VSGMIVYLFGSGVPDGNEEILKRNSFEQPRSIWAQIWEKLESVSIDRQINKTTKRLISGMKRENAVIHLNVP